MKNRLFIKNISDIITDTKSNHIRKKINCLNLNSDDINKNFTSPIYLNATIAFLVLNGSGEILINYKKYNFRKDSVILMTSIHLFNFIIFSKDIELLCLFVSKDFMEETDSTAMIFRRIKYGVRLFNKPLITFENEKFNLIKERVCDLNKTLDDKNHLYFKEIILNRLDAFYLDLSNIIDLNAEWKNDENQTRYEEIIKLFIEQLINNYRCEHKVEFYASKLNISAHYLTYIVKSVTGQTVYDFIFEMLFSDANSLLINSGLSIQEISDLLNFSNQSAFGKFFKRRSGLSPKEFRNNRFELINK